MMMMMIICEQLAPTEYVKSHDEQASGIITPVGCRPVHRLREDSSLNLCTTCLSSGGQNYFFYHLFQCDDTKCCIIQILPPDDSARNM